MNLKIGSIDNTGPNTLLSFLRNVGADSQSLDLAVAFVTSKGLFSVMHVLQRVANKRNVRFLTGLYQGFTEPAALRTLLRLERETGGKFVSKISTISHFHWKAYFLLKSTSAIAVIGSSNLTNDGLAESGEYNVALTLPRFSKEFDAVYSPFQRLWNSKSNPLAADAIDRYEAWRKANCTSAKGPSVPLSKILGKKTGRKSTRHLNVSFWRGFISGLLSKTTVSIIDETTDWDRRGFSYMSTVKPIYKTGDRLILFDFVDNVVRAAEIVETTQSPKKTPDGKHFAAYRFLRHIPQRRLVKRRWNLLKSEGLIRGQDDARSVKTVTEQRFSRFVANLKLNAQ